jgi:ketol-acid reductoisomerase
MQHQPHRGVQTLKFGSEEEQVVERSEYPKEKLQKMFAKDTFAMIGYGPQGRGQALNLRDNGMKVIVGVRKGRSYDQAVQDGFKPNETLFEDIGEAAKRGTIVMYLLSDAAQKLEWDRIKPHLTKGKTLYFSHGFSVVFADQTGVVPPKDVDVILAAPKGSGPTVRRLFTEGRGINSSVAVFQDASGQAWDRAYGVGVAIGSGYLFNTSFEHEVWSDLTGERGVLMGAIAGAMQAQFEVLRKAGHSPSEAFNETVEEATQSLYPLIGEKGMDWMFATCSTTAQRGALDWAPKFYKATLPLFNELYQSVRNGTETKRSIQRNSEPDYRQKLQKELDDMNKLEIWQVGHTVRKLRPENQNVKK